MFSQPHGVLTRTSLFFVAALAALSAFALGHGVGATAAPRAATVSPANVVLIIADDARYDDLAFMPNVQRLLVRQGTTFTRFFSPFPLCCPARATILTGEYAHNHGVLSNDAPLGGFTAFHDKSTLATWLTPKYRTGLVGKYLNQYGQLGNGPLYVPPGWDLWRGSPAGTYAYRNIGLNFDGAYVQTFPKQTSTNVIGDQSVGFLTDQSTEPFFLVSSFIAPHVGTPREPDDPRMGTPYVGKKYRDTYTGPERPQDPSFNEKDISDKRPSVQNKPRLTRRRIAALKESFAQRRESEHLLDDQVGKLVDALGRTGELDNTYLIFLSDNGYLQGEHRIYSGKGLPYTPASHVPLVIRGPGVPAGLTVDGMAGMQDLAPTILDLTQTQLPAGAPPVDGHSLAPMFTDSSVGDHRTLVLEAGDGQGGYAFHGLIRGDGWKYVEFTTVGVNEVEMYNLNKDPYELQNLSEDPHSNAKEVKLRAQLDQLKYCAASACP